MWLNGFNNNIKGYPMKECKKVRCPDPYMGPSQPGAPPDPAQPAQGPFGSGMYTLYLWFWSMMYSMLCKNNADAGGYSTVAYGQCLVDADTNTGDEVKISYVAAINNITNSYFIFKTFTGLEIVCTCATGDFWDFYSRTVFLEFSDRAWASMELSRGT